MLTNLIKCETIRFSINSRGVEMKYVALVQGYGEGCDYTIGCNLNWHNIEANSEVDALAKIQERLLKGDHEGGYILDGNLPQAIYLLSVEKTTKLSMELIAKQLDVLKEAELKKRIRDREMAELTKLKEKYE